MEINEKKFENANLKAGGVICTIYLKYFILGKYDNILFNIIIL